MKTKLTLEDFNLNPAELKELVTGAQKYLPPLEDPADNDPVFKRSNDYKQEPNRPLDE